MALRRAVAVDADAIAAEIAEKHGHGIERQPVDAASEALLEGRAELGLEHVLQLPRPEDTREPAPVRPLLRGQPHDVLGEQVELAARARAVGPHRFPMRQLAVAARLGQVIEEPLVLVGREHVLEIQMLEGHRLDRGRPDPAREIRGRRRRGEAYALRPTTHGIPLLETCPFPARAFGPSHDTKQDPTRPRTRQV